MAKLINKNSYSKLVSNNRKQRKKFNRISTEQLIDDFSPTYPYRGKFLKVGDMEVLLTKTARKDEQGNSIYLGTLVKRSGLFKNKVSSASHIAVKKF